MTMSGTRTEPIEDGPILNERQAAALLGVGPQTLQRWRLAGTGPAPLKFNGLIRYSRETVVTWAKAHEVGRENL
jgi:predicted site-specific integrase-resolvase